MDEQLKELWGEIYRSQLMIQALINALNKFIRPEVLLDEKDIALVEKTAARLLREKTETKETSNAPQERFLKESNIRQHTNRDTRRQASEASCGDSDVEGGEGS